ncbi:MAG: dipicolinate synthase subunit B [Firmicutes bacterium]|nr:dipicolinate synthase subunit B [Bacillota bacterium]
MGGILEGKRIGVAVSGSFCTLEAVMPELAGLVSMGAVLTPILSEKVVTLDTRYGTASDWRERIESLCGRKALTTVVEVEPAGPGRLFDLVAVVPCTGNTLAKIAGAITDGPVGMAVKVQLRNQRPVVLAITTNDGLGLSAVNWAGLLAARNVYMVPFGQDNPREKPSSLVARMEFLIPTIEMALQGKQIQPILIEYR